MHITLVLREKHRQEACWGLIGASLGREKRQPLGSARPCLKNREAIRRYTTLISCLCTHTYIFIHTHTHIYIHLYIGTHTHTHKCINPYTHIRIHTYSHMHTHRHIQMLKHTQMQIHMHTCRHTQMHKHTRTHTQASMHEHPSTLNIKWFAIVPEGLGHMVTPVLICHHGRSICVLLSACHTQVCTQNSIF